MRVSSNTLWITGHRIEIPTTQEVPNQVGGEGQFLSLQAPGPCRLGKRLVGFCG